MSSQSQSNSNRLTALDGLRGISSLLVLLSHLKLDTPMFLNLIHFIPLRLAIKSLLNMGIISVGYFFILCGFLMVYLYENPESYSGFIQKRYFRIFSVLIVAVIISFSVMYLGVQNVGLLLATLIIVPVAFRLVYTAIFKLLRNRFLFWFLVFFIGSQVLVAFMNYFIVFRIGAHEFFNLPKLIYTTFMFATNYTLTFIFGDYIPMVDGGYWSLVSEVMFYLMYPLLAWFLIASIKKLSKWYWILWYFASMVTFHGLLILFKNLLGFETTHIHFAHFFTVGMMIALASKTRHQSFMKLLQFFETWYGQVTSLLCYILPLLLAYWVGLSYDAFKNSLVAYVSAPLMGFAVISIIAQRNILSRFLRNRVFLFLGAISFPLYVIHSPIVHVLWQTMRIERDPSRWALYLFLASTLSLGAAYYLHIVIERFYFVVTKQMKKNKEIRTVSRQHLFVKLVISSLLICLVLIFVAFQQDFSLLSFIQNHDNQTIEIKNLQNTQYSLLKNNKIQGKFLADEDNLGIVTMKILHIGPVKQDRGIQEKKDVNILIFRMREVGDKTWYHESRHIAWQISSEKPYPFGFPQIVDSRNKWFEFELESKSASSQDYVILNNPVKDFQSVYKLPKKLIMNKPAYFLSILSKKVFGAFSQRDAQIVLAVYLFTLWFIWFIQYTAKKVTSNERIMS